MSSVINAGNRPGFARRLASLVYEMLLVAAVLSVAFLFPHILYGAFTKLQAPAALIRLHFFLVLMIYFVWFWLNGGQTLAMKTWKLRVVNIDGRRLRPAQAVLRYMAAWFSYGLFGLGIVWALFDPERQYLHDRIAGTRIIAETQGS
ncbi:MAG: RDD family protein [Zoogloeaceae bacterium]|nr:RDD family protein [Zoogloeaceae bacterium]